MRICALLSIAACLACAHENAAVEPTPLSFSSPGASMSTSYASTPGAFRTNISADVVVRPDRVCIPIAIGAYNGDAGALKIVEDAANKVKAAASGTSFVIEDIDVASAGNADGAPTSTVLMRAVVEADLPDGDAWTRAKRVLEIHGAVTAIATSLDAQSKVKSEGPFVQIAVGKPEPGVKDAESHRAELLKAWSGRAKALAQAVTTEGAKLDLNNCAPPAEVLVVGGTLEKVGLSLPVSCTFTVSR